MPEDLEDKITDFGLMLEGYCADMKEDESKRRVLSYWYSLSSEVKDRLDGKVS